jgi:flagellar FliL protein
MSQTADKAITDTETPKKKKGLMPILIGVVGALALGVGGFYAIYSGMILGHDTSEKRPSVAAASTTIPSYMPIDQLTLSLANPEGAQHLRLSAQIEVADGRLAEAEGYRPRFLAVMNTYLRAIEPRDLQDSASLIRLRAQILRRLQMVAGDDLVNDFLITEFILN